MVYDGKYTSDTTDIEVGTQTYKYSQNMSELNPDRVDNTFSMCSPAELPPMQYFATYLMPTGTQGGMWQYENEAITPTMPAASVPFSVGFVIDPNNAAFPDEAGQGTVYQIGKPIYEHSQQVATSDLRVFNPTDLRHFVFAPTIVGYELGSNTLVTHDLDYTLKHRTSFYGQGVKFTPYMWDGEQYTRPAGFETLQPALVGSGFIIPLENVLQAPQVIGQTDNKNRKDFVTSFYGLYDENDTPITMNPVPTSFTVSTPVTEGVVYGAVAGGMYWWTSNSYLMSMSIAPSVDGILTMLAHCGCYMIGGQYDFTDKTPENLYDDEYIWLGEMIEGCYTTGNFIRGKDIPDSDTINAGAFNTQSDYNPVAPKPVLDEDKELDMSIGNAGISSAMVLYYATSDAGALNEISQAVGKVDSVTLGRDITRGLVSLKAFPMAPGKFLFTPNTLPVAISGVSMRREDDTAISLPVVSRPVDYISCGSISIPHTFNDFRDYAPYTKLECFVPFCGWVALPSHCMGRTVSARLAFDYVNGSCVGHVYCGETVVATVSGYMAVDLPFVAENTGMKMAGVVSGMSAIGSAAVGLAGSAALANPLGVASAGVGLINGVSQTVMSSNANYTQMIGRTGDGCNINGLKRMYIKVQRPQTGGYSAPNYVPSNYGRAVGFVCNKTKTLGSCRGLTVCENVDLSGINATKREKDIIKSILERGVRV